MISDVFITGIVFFGIYSILRLISVHFLKRKLIKDGQYENVGILEPPKPNEETNRYPSLKWGLVALTTGLGLILIEVLKVIKPGMIDFRDAFMPFGILLVFISLGFLIYFFIVNKKQK